MSAAQRLLTHLAAMKLLRRMAKDLDPAAGLSISICNGPANSEGVFHAQVDVEIVTNMKPVLEAIIVGLKETMRETAIHTARERDEATAALATYEAEKP